MPHLILAADVPQGLHGVPVAFVLPGKAERNMLVIFPVFHTLPPAMPGHAHLGEKLKSSSNILSMFSLPLHNFIRVKGRIIKEKEKKDLGSTALHKCISQQDQNVDRYPTPWVFSHFLYLEDV